MIHIKFARQMFPALLLLMAVLLLESYSDLDLFLQKFLFDFESSTWVLSSSDHKALRLFFYDGPKMVVGAIGLGALAALLYSFKDNKWRQRRWALTLFLSIALVPLFIGGGKEFSNVYCPGQLSLFGGQAPYQRLLAAYQAGDEALPKGRCFPAGHASGGFALMALFFCFSKRRGQLAGLATGLTAGWVMGIYQMLRGQHFFSHTVASMLAAWIIIISIDKLSGFLFPADGQPGPRMPSGASGDL